MLMGLMSGFTAVSSLTQDRQTEAAKNNHAKLAGIPRLDK